MDPTVVAEAVDELAGFLRADGADLLVREANPKTARVHLARGFASAQTQNASRTPSSWPGSTRPSTPWLGREQKAWIRGSSPRKTI